MREKFIEMIQKSVNGCARNWAETIADYILAEGYVVLPSCVVEPMYDAVDALADMVNQFGYSTTFRKQDAVCDGGLSALENAFGALYYCGIKMNSNETINRKNLCNYSIKKVIENYWEKEQALKEGAE